MFLVRPPKPIKYRSKRQIQKSSDNIGDAFLRQPIVSLQPNSKVSTVLDSIDNFDRLNNVEQREAANVDILNGAHVSVCSNQEEGIFLSVLFESSVNFDRDNMTYTPRSFNFASHDYFISTKSNFAEFSSVYSNLNLLFATILFQTLIN